MCPPTKLDRWGSVVVGQLLPYNEALGERVMDGSGQVWFVVSSSVRPAPEADDVR